MAMIRETEVVDIENKNISNSQVDNTLPEKDSAPNWNLGQVGRDIGYRHQISIPDQLSTMDVESGYISNRRKRATSVGSGITNLAFDRNEADHVTQLGNNHYMIRRRGTKIHIKGFPSIKSPNERSLPGRNEDILEETMQEEKGSISTLLSGLYALHLFLFTMAFKIAKEFTDNVTMRMFDYYLISLYSVSLGWMITYHPLASSCYREQERIGYEKSSHSTNRYLKGVVAVFGLAIIIKDGLEFLAYLGIDNPDCTDKELYAALPIIHSIFILSQVNYLFRYSKVFIQDFQALSRFGLMHVVATDLTVWISTIIDETSAALSAYDDHEGNSSSKYYLASTYGKAGNIHTDILFSENCTCDDSFCQTISIAEAFLYPFVIEFSLVACCLLYVTWRNVGKASHACQQIIRPSYRLYKSYIGVVAGSLMLFAMIIVMIVLATNTSETKLEHRDFFSEHHFLNIHNIFIIVIGLLISLACLCGFYLFHITTHDIDKNGGENLDNVLLLICLSGPSLLSLFSIIAFSANDYLDSRYVPSLVMQIVEMISCVVQVIFIMYGLKLKPITSDESQETVAEVQRTISTSDPLDTGSEYEADESGDDEEVYCRGRSRTTSISSLARKVRYPNLRPAFNFNTSLPRKCSNISEMAEVHDTQKNATKSFSSDGFEIETTATTLVNGVNRKIGQIQMDSVFEEESDSNAEEKNVGTKSEAGDVPVQVSSDLQNTSNSNTPVDTDSNEKQSPQPYQNFSPLTEPMYTSQKQQQRLRKNDILRKRALVNSLNQSPQHAVKIISETKVADPDQNRLLLRNVLTFLLIANACLWLYWSLNGTAFTLYEYQNIYYERNVWIVITMFCRPFTIFFRMHSAACLFEIWSFA